MVEDKSVLRDVVDIADDYVYDYLKKRILVFALEKLGMVATGFWGAIVAKLVLIFLDKVVIPALEDMKEEGFLFLRKKELERKLREYIEASTDEEFDAAFDNLIKSSRY